MQWSTGTDFYLYSGSRRSDAVLAWDMRVLSGNNSHPIQGIMSFPRENDTNQRLEFDLSEDGTKLFTASQDKSVKIYDVKTGTLIKNIRGFDDAVNGISFKSTAGNDLLSVAAGARRFDEDYYNDETCDLDSNMEKGNDFTPGSLSLYHL